MKHPEPHQWMAFLYGEVSREERLDLDAHLAVCPDCARRLGRWRETQGLLDAAGVPERKTPARSWQPMLLRAAAAALVLGLGFALGRQGTVSEDQLDRRLVELRGQLKTDLSAQRDSDLRQVAEASARVARTENREFFEAFFQRYQAARAEDRRDLVSALQAIDERRVAETAELRGSLASLASSTGTGFEQAQHQMRWLTSYLPAARPPAGTREGDTP